MVTTCATCSDTVDFRVLNTITSRCDPIIGYWDDLINSLALPCDSTCLGCVGDAITCTSCPLGKHLSVNICVTCLLNCLDCTTASNCNQCATSYAFNPVSVAC